MIFDVSRPWSVGSWESENADVVPVTVEDVQTLKNDWLTDNVCPEMTGKLWIYADLIFRQSPSGRSTTYRAHNFCISQLMRRARYLEREELKKFPQSHIVLLRPSMAFMLMQTPDPLTLKSALPDFTHTTHIFLPINDAHNPNVAEGGSHWSLLLVSVLDGVAFHYDSLHPSNHNEAKGAVHKLSRLLGTGIRFVDLEDTPQQENGSDCGVYVCVQMRHLLLKRLLSANAREKVSMSMGGKLVDAAGGRKEMLRTIEGFRKEGERRRS